MNKTRKMLQTLPRNFVELREFAGLIAKSELLPKPYCDNPANILVAVQMGAELGLTPMQSLQNIVVIHGRPAIWGDALLAVCRQSDWCDSIEENIEGEGGDIRQMVAVCRVKRCGDSHEIVSRFSGKDARKAKLLNKVGIWSTHPKQMLQLKARSLALRDAFPGLLKGLILVEEAMEMDDRKLSPLSDNEIGLILGKLQPFLSVEEQVQFMSHKISAIDDLDQLNSFANQWINALNKQRKVNSPIAEPVISAIAKQFAQAYANLVRFYPVPSPSKPVTNTMAEELP